MLLSVGLRGYAEVKGFTGRTTKRDTGHGIVLVSKYGCTLNAQQIYLHILEEFL